MKINGRLILFTLILVALATACKFFFGPDLAWSGFSPLIAIALFSGMIMRQKKDMSFVLPLLSVFISDAIIQLLYEQGKFDYQGFYSGQWKNYLLLLLPATLVGLIFKGKNYKNLLLGGIIAPTVYFLLSNFNVWLSTTEVVYTKDFTGLLTCYEAGLPFYRNALIATLVFLPVILFSYNYLTRHRAALIVA
ncbi:MAG: DUF6580 family putative transport protein [Chitinophagaceae bacterium]